MDYEWVATGPRQGFFLALIGSDIIDVYILRIIRGDPMKIKQINVVLENTAGQLYELAALLHRADIDIRSLFVTEGREFSTIHLIVDKFEVTMRLLKEHGYFANVIDVFALKAEDKPGGFMKVLEVLRANGLNIEYVYGFGEKSDNHAVFIFRISEIDKAIELLKSGAIKYLSSDRIEGRQKISAWELIDDF